MTKTYTVAGLATDKQGKTKVKYANSLDQRLKVLQRDGFTNLNFIHADTPKTKVALCAEMLNLIQFQNDKQIIINELEGIKKRDLSSARKKTLYSGSAYELLDAIK
jgi:uncharacterized membrane-anchored protein